jgi:pyridoxine kinase
MGLETAIVPTTLMGRHPGWGPPGGGAVPAAQLKEIWRAIAQQPLIFDAVMTGYMGKAAHISLAEDIIAHVKKRNPAAKVLVDPVMGDSGRLYVSPDIAAAIKSRLVPLADILTPNLWELSFLSNKPYNTLLQSPLAAAQAAEEICKSQSADTEVLVTSVPFPPQTPSSAPDKIGAVLMRKGRSPLFMPHEKFARVPHGGGDTLAAAYLARRLGGEPVKISLAKSMGSIFQIMSASASAQNAGAGVMSEISLITAQDALINPVPLKCHKSFLPSI